MLTYVEIEMLRHALTSDFEQLAYHDGTAECKASFLKMSEKLEQLLGIAEHLVDETKYSGEWKLYLQQKQFTE